MSCRRRLRDRRSTPCRPAVSSKPRFPIGRLFSVAGHAVHERRARHRGRQRAAGPVLRAARVHGRRGGRDGDTAPGPGSPAPGRREAEAVRGQVDPAVGQPSGRGRGGGVHASAPGHQERVSGAGRHIPRVHRHHTVHTALSDQGEDDAMADDEDRALFAVRPELTVRRVNGPCGRTGAGNGLSYPR